MFYLFIYCECKYDYDYECDIVYTHEIERNPIRLKEEYKIQKKRKIYATNNMTK